jgi:hypothetical protein
MFHHSGPFACTGSCRRSKKSSPQSRRGRKETPRGLKRWGGSAGAVGEEMPTRSPTRAEMSNPGPGQFPILSTAPRTEFPAPWSAVAECNGDTALDSSAVPGVETLPMKHPKRCGAPLPTAVHGRANPWSAVAECNGDTALDSSAVPGVETLPMKHPKRCGAPLPTAVHGRANAWSAVAECNGDTALDSSAVPGAKTLPMKHPSPQLQHFVVGTKHLGSALKLLKTS